MIRLYRPILKRMRIHALAFSLFLLSSCSGYAQQAPSATPAPAAPLTAQQKTEIAAGVRAETLHAWEGYRKYAWGHDELPGQ